MAIFMSMRRMKGLDRGFNITSPKRVLVTTPMLHPISDAVR